MASRESYWPLFGLRVRTPRLELRYPDDDDLVALAAVAAGGVHDPDFMPFDTPWTDVAPPQQQRNTLQFFWLQRANWSIDDWNLTLVAVVDGDVVGTQGVGSKMFAKTHAVVSGSWLGRDHQGKGSGKEMRAAMLHLAFAGLGAEVALSAAFHDNGPSLGVSKALGYEENGDEIAVRRGKADRHIRLKLPRERWEQHQRDDIEIVGLDPCRPMFGLE